MTKVEILLFTLNIYRTGRGNRDFVKIQELPVIGLEETINLATQNEVLPVREDHVSMSSGIQHVMCEEDIIGQKASIVYESTLKHLVTFLQLPIVRCNFIETVTNVSCHASGPFEVHLSSRGTGTVIHWVNMQTRMHFFFFLNI